jgi:DNA polymerase-3 subunit epsilon
VLLAAHLNGAAENLTLDRLTQIYGVTLPPDKRHTALGDAIATAEVLLAQIDHLASVGVVTLNQALAVSEAQVKIRQQQNKYS